MERFWIFKRGSTYYLEDTATHKQESLRTKDKREAERIRAAKNESVRQPSLNLALAKVYLSGHDRTLPDRTWQTVMERFCEQEKPATRIRNERA